MTEIISNVGWWIGLGVVLWQIDRLLLDMLQLQKARLESLKAQHALDRIWMGDYYECRKENEMLRGIVDKVIADGHYTKGR